MASLIDQLIDVLSEQAENFEYLLGLSKEKTDVIIQNDVKALQKITSIENVLIGQNQKFERGRAAVIKDIAVVLNVKESALTLSALTDLLEKQPGGGGLRAVADRIRSAAAELRDVNERNQMLINSSLEYLDFSINLMRSASEPSFYSANGEEVQNEKGFFDTKQ